MSRVDLISDCFTVIRNAVAARKEDALIPYSQVMAKICAVLKDEGYLENYKEIYLEHFKQIKVYLKYEAKQSVLHEIQRVSTPGRRVYAACRDIPRALDGYGVTIISSSAGIMTDKQAREKGVGGEVIGMIW